MKDIKETPMTELDPQVMAHDLQVLTSVNYGTVYHLLYRNPASCRTQDGTVLNASWIINCIPKFTMDLLCSFSSFSLPVLKIIIIHTYI